MLGLLLAAMVGLVLVVTWALLDVFVYAMVVTLLILAGGVVLGTSMLG